MSTVGNNKIDNNNAHAVIITNQLIIMIKRVRCDSVHLLITKLGCNFTGAYPGCMLLARCMLLVKGGLVSHASELMYWHSHQEISPCTLNRLESQWKTFPSLPGLDGLRAGGLLVISWCAGLESRATHSSGVALEASVLSVPHFL